MSSDLQVMNVAAGTSVSVSASGTSADESITLTNARAVHVVNTSATLYVSVRLGVGAQTAVLADDVSIPPMGQIVIAFPAGSDTCAAIGSGAGPTIVKFTPVFNT